LLHVFELLALVDVSADSVPVEQKVRRKRRYWQESNT